MLRFAAASLTHTERTAAPLFLPYLSGERTPHNQPLASGVWFGMNAAHGRPALAHSVAEGVGFGLLDGLQTLSATEPALHALSLVGGGARNAWWAQLLADTLWLSLRVHAGGETGAALGVARLGWLACGGALDRVCITPPVTHSFEPAAAAHTELAGRHARFQALYAALLPHWMSTPHALALQAEE